MTLSFLWLRLQLVKMWQVCLVPHMSTIFSAGSDKAKRVVVFQNQK